MVQKKIKEETEREERKIMLKYLKYLFVYIYTHISNELCILTTFRKKLNLEMAFGFYALEFKTASSFFLFNMVVKSTKFKFLNSKVLIENLTYLKLESSHLRIPWGHLV